MKKKHSTLIKLCFLLLILLFFCEYGVYYLVITQCSWPVIRGAMQKVDAEQPLKAMFLADTHLLGPRKGHWLDKLRREWQMHRAFQTAIALFNPEVVFILGDLFDEGQWSHDEEFNEYVKRFYSLFEVPKETEMFVVAGNHDMGFHYKVRPVTFNRFNAAFNLTSVKLLTLKGSHFILINSMAMEGDGCFFCKPAKVRLSIIARDLNCVNDDYDGVKLCPAQMTVKKYGRPIILQHFPMYRESDAECNEPDEAPENIKNDAFREKWECLSKTASEMIYDKLSPRLILTGHTHHGCHLLHREDIHEFTLPSFSWRNKNNPSFMLASISETNYAVNKCFIPKETTVITLYCVGLAFIIIWLWSLFR